MALAVVALGCMLGSAIVRANYHDHIGTCTVTDKDRGADHKGNSHYRVYTEQCGVLANEDQFLAAKTNSADVWSQIKVGHTYRFRIVGGRFSPLSMFPNIVEVQGEVAEQANG